MAARPRLAVVAAAGALLPGAVAVDAQARPATAPAARAGAGAVGTRTLDVRRLNNAGFEIVLPGGARVLVDPWLDSAAVAPEPLAKTYKLDVSKLYKVGDGQRFRFDDVTIQAFAGRHTEAKAGNYLDWDDHGELTAASWGTLELFQYLVTDRNGTSFLVGAGTPSIDNAYRLAGLRPDIAAMHVSPKQDFAVMARIIRAIEPQVVIPHHYDIWPTILRTRPGEAEQFPRDMQPVTPETVVGRMMPYVAGELRKGGVTADWFTPDHARWYRYERRGSAQGTVFPATRQELPTNR